MAIFEGSYVFIHGLYFIPSDEELMREYLLKKFRGEEVHLNVIEEYNVYSTEPWNLPRNLMHSKDGKVYYFSEAKRSTPGSSRLLRLAGNGYWHMNGGTKKINDESNHLGNTTTLNYKYGPTKRKTRWVMNEYRINPAFLDNSKSTELVLCSIQESGRGEKTSSIIRDNSSSSSNNHLLGCSEALVTSDLNVDHGPKERSLAIVCNDGYHATKTEPLRIPSSNCNGEYRPEIALPPLKRPKVEEEGLLLGSTSTEAVGINNNSTVNGDIMSVDHGLEKNVLLNGGQTTYHNSMCPPFIVGTQQVSCMESLEPNFIYAPNTTTSTVTATSTREDGAHAAEMLQYSSQQQQQQQHSVGNEHISMDMRINFTSRDGKNYTSMWRLDQTMWKI